MNPPVYLGNPASLLKSLDRFLNAPTHLTEPACILKGADGLLVSPLYLGESSGSLEGTKSVLLAIAGIVTVIALVWLHNGKDRSGR